MEKLKRYLGLAAAIALLVLGFTPTGRDHNFPWASSLTPLDASVLSMVTVRQDIDMQYLRYATNHFNSCPPFQKEARVMRYEAHPCRGEDYLFLEEARMREPEIAAIEPAFTALMNEYEEVKRAENDRFQSAPRLIGEPVARDERAVQLELLLGRAMARHLDTLAVGLATNIYLLHGMLLLVASLMVVWRQYVGAVLCFPFTLLFGAASASAKAAKSLHDKV